MSYFNQESERLKFRKATLEDIRAWSDFFVGNDRLHFLGMDAKKSKQELSQQMINRQRMHYETNGYGHLVAELKSTSELIAMGGIIPREIKEKSEFEIGYCVIPRFWGKGYATEISRAMKQFAFGYIKASRVISIIDVENHSSAKVAVKNGMRILFQTEFRGASVNIYGVENSGEAIVT